MPLAELPQEPLLLSASATRHVSAVPLKVIPVTRVVAPGLPAAAIDAELHADDEDAIGRSADGVREGERSAERAGDGGGGGRRRFARGRREKCQEHCKNWLAVKN